MADSDLNDAERSAIEAAERLAEGTHWEILGLTAGATASDIKRAYFEASKRFHPDRYFGKHLGAYRARLEALFIRAKRAYEVLGDDSKRESYAKVNPPPRKAPPPPVKTAEELAAERERERRLEERRKELASARREKLKVQVRSELSTLKVRKLAGDARVALDKSDLTAASTAIDGLVAAQPHAKETLMLAAELCERQGKKAQAIEKYRMAQELDAADADVTKAIQRLTRRA